VEVKRAEPDEEAMRAFSTVPARSKNLRVVKKKEVERRRRID
jgi:hypothetical protein